MYTRPGYLPIIGLQLLIVVVVTGFWGIFRGSAAAASSLIGGLVCVVPSALFALRLWAAGRAATRNSSADAGARDGWAFGLTFAVGELVKVFLTGVGFVLVFKLYPGVDALALFVTFIATLQGYLFGLLIDRDPLPQGLRKPAGGGALPPR